MKKKLLFVLCCAALIAGCTTDPYDLGNEVVMGGTPRINISGAISQEYISRVNDGGFCQDDQVGLFGVNYTDNNTIAGELLDEGNQVDNARYTYDEANNKWESSGNIYYKDSKTNIDLYAYYPYSTVNSVNEYVFEVQRDQSGENTVDGYSLSDFLWGKATNVAPTEQKIKILFNHKMACANVILVEGEGFDEGEFASLKKSVLVMNTTRTSTIDLATGIVSATGEVESEGIVMKSNDEGYKAIVIPQTVAAGASLFSITIDGVAYRFKKDVDFTYEQGKQAKFTIEIKKKVPSGDYEFSLVDCEIVDWIADLDTHGGEARQYYVVHCNEPGTLGKLIESDRKDPLKIKNLKVSGTIAEPDLDYISNLSNLAALNLKEAQIVSVNSIGYYFSTDGNSQNYGVECFTFDKSSAEDYREDILARHPEIIDIWGFSHSKTEANSYSRRIPRSIISLVFPERLTKICSDICSGCTKLSGTVIIPDGVADIPKAAFNGCSNVTSIILPSGLKTIGYDEYWYNPNGVSSFGGCTNLTSIEIPPTVTYIGIGAFYGCKNISGQLVLPEGLTYLGEWAFRDCHSLTGNLEIPQSLKHIKPYTFYGCEGLNGILKLHDDLTLSDYCFYNCKFQGELNLPSNLIDIPSYSFRCCEFSSMSTLPQNLESIGNYAFQGCWKMSGIIEFPESFISIGELAFESCSSLEGIILPAELGVIKNAAFASCYNLCSIRCNATEPPIIQSGAFDGVAKDNFTVEVPEISINRYQSDPNWAEFKRIGAYHDFSISRREMRVLNAEHSREFMLRAPADLAWSVESQPDWCTITPSSGVGKQNVVITVKEMTDADIATFEINTGTYNSPNYETHAGRASEIVFLLNDKDYRTTLKVEQYDADIADGQVIVNQTTSADNGVNIVFMGDCFDARDIAMGSYLNGINEAIGYYFDIEPYKTYKDYFNVYTVVGMSNDSGMGTVNTIRDAKFGSQYTINAGVAPNESITFEYAMTAPTVNEENLGKTLVVMVENTTEYGGICYMWGDGSAIACCPMSDDAYPYDFRGIVQHEAGGHGFGKLGDEYIYHNGFISACPICGSTGEGDVKFAHSLGWYRNLSLTGNMDEVAWSHLIFHPNYSNIVDVYEGGYMHSRGCFRSEPNSCMNNNIPYFSAISRQEIVERIMKYAGKPFNLDDFYYNDVLDAYGSITGKTRMSVEENAITLTGAGKQMPPKFMGDKPKLKKSNK